MAAWQLKNSEQWQRRARAGLMLALVVWLAWLLADTLWLLLSGPARPVSLDPDMTLLHPDDAGATAPGVSAETVQAWQLFGPLGASADQASVADAPETRLRLELLGVFQNVDAANASAIIAEQGKDAELYHPGDKVPGNATLEEVLADRVILMRLGQREALRLKESELSPGAVSSTASSRRPAPPVTQDQPPAVQGGDATDLGQQRNMIITQLGLQPADAGGYEIGAGAPEQVLQIVGLKPGDVLVSVNGYELGNEEADIAALDAFRSTGSASIVVQRGAQRFTVNYPP